MATNYTLGRGELYFDRFAPGTQVGVGERYLGNTPEVNYTIESETLDHFSSDKGINEKDDSVILSVNRSGSFTADDIKLENLALFFFGSESTLTVSPATGVDNLFEGVTQGSFYQLGTTTAAPAGARNVASVVVTDGEVSPTTYVLNTDYRLEAALGRIEIIEGGAIDNDSDIEVTFNIGGSTSDLVISGSTPVEGALRYVARNPKGRQIDYFFPWVSIAPNGDYSLKGDDWQTIPFLFEILKKQSMEAIYATRRPA